MTMLTAYIVLGVLVLGAIGTGIWAKLTGDPVPVILCALLIAAAAALLNIPSSRFAKSKKELDR